MQNPNDINRVRLKAVARALGGLEQPIVFVGGATVSLYGQPGLSTESRPTDDVDVLVELASYGGYGPLSERLLTLGFQPDIMSGVICRYRVQGILVDVMPTEPSVLGFSNLWYPEGFRAAFDYPLDEEVTIKLLMVPYFLATKLEAFADRGGRDFRQSSDFEDLVYVLDNAPELEFKLREGSADVQSYLRQTFGTLLAHDDFEEGIYSHLEPRYASMRTARIRQILIDFVQKSDNLMRRTGFDRST